MTLGELTSGWHMPAASKPEGLNYSINLALLDELLKGKLGKNAKGSLDEWRQMAFSFSCFLLHFVTRPAKRGSGKGDSGGGGKCPDQQDAHHGQLWYPGIQQGECRAP
jgi:hypothetical protein